MEEKDELQQFLNRLSKQASMPDPAFKKKLLNKMLPKTNFWKAFGFRTLYMGATLSVSLALLLLVLNSLGYLALPGKEMQITIEGEQIALLTNVYKSNPANVLSNIHSSPEEMGNESYDLTQENINYQNLINKSQQTQVEKNYNYFKTTAENLLGPQADICPTLKAEAKMANTETYIFEQKGNFAGIYLKVINKDNNRNMISYNLMTPTEDYMYYGGKYALKIINKDPANAITEKTTGYENAEITDALKISKEPITEESEQIKALFGNETTITKKVVQGKDLYLIEYRTQNYACTGTGPSATTSDNAQDATGELVFVFSIDPGNNFQVVQRDVYKKTIEEKNLVIRTKYTYIQNNLTYSEVKDEFSFNVPVEIKAVNSYDYSVANNFRETVNSTLVNNRVSLIFTGPSNEYSIKGLFYEPGAYLSGYFLDRDFYSSERAGQEKYAENYASYTSNPLISYNFQDPVTKAPFSVSIFSSAAKKDRLLSGLYKDLPNAEKITITINNAKINAEIYEYQAEMGSYANYLLYFEYNGNKYLVDTPKPELGVYPDIFIALLPGSEQSKLVLPDQLPR